MERLSRTLAGCGLMILLATAGCRSAGSRVPPGRPFSGDGRQADGVSFSTDGHPSNNANNPLLAVQPPGMAGQAGSQPNAFGTPMGNGLGTGLPAQGSFGPPGTSGAAPGAGGTSLMGGSPMSPPSVDPTANPPLGYQPNTSPSSTGSAALGGFPARGTTGLPGTSLPQQ